MTPQAIMTGFGVAMGIVVLIFVAIFWVLWQRRKKQRQDHTQSSAKPKAQHSTSHREKDQTVADRRRLTYRYADDYLFVDGDYVFTAVRLGSWTDEAVGNEKLYSMAATPETVLGHLAGDSHKPVSCHFRSFPRVKSPEEWAEDRIKRAPNPSSKFANQMRAEAIYLAQEERTVYEQVVIVRLGHISSKTAPQKSDEAPLDPLRVWAEANRFAGIFDGVSDDYLNPESIGEWTAEATRVHERFQKLGGSPFRRADLIQLIRSPLYGHLPVPPVEDFGQQVWGPGQFQLALDFKAERKGKYLVIEQPDPITGEMTRSYQTTLVVADFPKSAEFNAARAWCKLASTAKTELGFHVNTSWRFDLLPFQKVLDVAEKAYGNLEDEIKDKESVGGTPTKEQRQNRDIAKEWVDDINEHKLAGMEGQIRFIIAAPSEAELTRRVSRFGDYMREGAQMILAQPGHMQVALLREALPGYSPKALIAPYMRFTDLSMFGYGLPMSSTKVGDEVTYTREGRQKSWIGGYIGDTLVEKLPTYFDGHSTLARDGGGATISIAGRTGAGKTAFTTRQFDEASESGQECLALDPKDDIARFVLYRSFGSQVVEPGFEEEYLAGTLGTPGSKFQPTDPEYWRDSLITDITKAREGSLDPFVIEDDPDQARLLASEILDQMLGEKAWDEFETDVTDALDAVVQEDPEPTLYKVVQFIKKQADAAHEFREGKGTEERIERLYRRMRALMRLPLSRLAFAKDQKTAYEARARGFRRQVFTMPGVGLPTGDPSAWREPQRMTAGVMQLVLRMMAIHSRRDRDAKAHIFVDEAHVFASYDAAVASLKTSMRMIRVLNTILWLITQNASDLAKLDSGSNSSETEATINQLQAMFVFSQRGDADIRAALKMASVEGNSKLSQKLHELTPGQFLMIDPLSRMATVQSNRIFDVIVWGTDTNAETRRESQANPVPYDPMDWTYEHIEGVEGKTTARELLTKYPHLLRATPDDLSVPHDSELQSEVVAA